MRNDDDPITGHLKEYKQEIQMATKVDFDPIFIS